MPQNHALAAGRLGPKPPAGAGIPPQFLLRAGPMLGQHRCITYKLTPLITEQICALLSMHFKQQVRRLYSTNSTGGYLPLIPAVVPEPLASPPARKGCPMQHTAAGRAEARHLTELINEKPGCLVFSSLGFKKKCFPNIVACHKVFPPLPVASPVLGWQSRIRWQAVQQTAASVSCHPSTGPY